MTENDYELGLYNGDTGVIVAAAPASVRARRSSAAASCSSFSPLRLGAVETVYAMTIHKSQGSQFDTAAVLLPAPSSRILTRELLYTAVTRARQELILVGTEEAVRPRWRGRWRAPPGCASGCGARLRPRRGPAAPNGSGRRARGAPSPPTGPGSPEPAQMRGCGRRRGLCVPSYRNALHRNARRWKCAEAYPAATWAV